MFGGDDCRRIRHSARTADHIRLAQVDVYYYAYGFDTGLEEVYYWYPAEDVIVTDIWIEYVPV